MRSPSRYAEGSPRFTAYGELNACCDRASGSVKRVVVRMPYSEAVRPTRLADLSILSYGLGEGLTVQFLLDLL